MAYSDAISPARCGVLFAVLAAACQRVPGSDEFGNLDSNDDGNPTSSTSDTGNVDDSNDDADGSDGDDDSPGTDDGNPTLDCDPVAQSGCNPDEKCTVTESAGEITYTCVADVENLDPFSPCTQSLGTGMDGCPRGYACLADDGDNGICVQLCLDNGDCDDALCLVPLTVQAPYCGATCSPFETPCPSPLQCRRKADQFACSFASTTDTGVQNEDCNLLNDGGCSEGFVCLPGDLVPGCSTTNCCTNVCDLTGDGSCDSPTICESIFEAPAPGSEGIGACFVPS
ncbi:MAG TPA: hypothetical protein VFG69_13980 [Nannocystaceae bacterium]|nr:hypothetical protein [Nannocystaceae bacterium]